MYGLETWTLKQADVVRLEAFKMWVLEQNGENEVDIQTDIHTYIFINPLSERHYTGS